MKKIQCPYIEKGENVHEHACPCCEGDQHIPFAKALKYYLYGLCVLDGGGRDASDTEMHDRIKAHIEIFKSRYDYRGEITFNEYCCEEPLSTLRACINSLHFK